MARHNKAMRYERHTTTSRRSRLVAVLAGVTLLLGPSAASEETANSQDSAGALTSDAPYASWPQPGTTKTPEPHPSPSPYLKNSAPSPGSSGDTFTYGDRTDIFNALCDYWARSRGNEGYPQRLPDYKKLWQYTVDVHGNGSPMVAMYQLQLRCPYAPRIPMG